MALAYKSLQRVGNSTGVVLPPEILRESGIERGDEIMIRAEQGSITITRREAIRDEVLRAAEDVIARYDATFRKLAE